MAKLLGVSPMLIYWSVLKFAGMTFILTSVLSNPVTKEMTYAAVKDAQGNLLCATDEPNQVLTVRSKPMCFFRCQDGLQCWAVNWKYQTQSCEIYSYNPKGYSVSTGCSFLIPGEFILTVFKVTSENCTPHLAYIEPSSIRGKFSQTYSWRHSV